MQDDSDDVRDQAADWFARMRGPDPASHEAALAAWRAERPDHDQAYRQLLIRWDQSRFGNNLGAVRSRDLSRASRWHRRPTVRLAVAGLIALFALGLGYHFLGPRMASSVPEIAYQSRVGEIRTVALADGSRVTLDSASAIKVSFTGTTRSATLTRGMARFDVAKDARPFTVVTSRGAVVADNAMFDVSDTAGLVKVSALRGTLTFRGQDERPGRGSPAARYLRQGQGIAASASDGLGAAVPVSPDAADWPNGMLSFDNERLADAVLEFNRHNRRQLVIADARLAGLRITGAFHANDPAGFARALGAMVGLAVSDGPDGAIELRAKKVVG